MKKRLFSLLCALTLLLGALPSAAALEGESRRAAETLAALHLIDSIPDARTLSTGATRLQAAQVLARLSGETGKSAEAVEYAVSQGWFAEAGSPRTPVETSEFCAALLRTLGYKEGVEDASAALYARRMGLTARDYEDSLTLGELYQVVRDALVFPNAQGVAAARALVEKGVCTQAEIAPLFPEELTARQVADRRMCAVFSLDTYYTEDHYKKLRPDNGGSGFFITSDGVAVTNCHTIEDAKFASATLVTGEIFPVEKVLFYDVDADLAVLKISKTLLGGKLSVPAFAHLDIAEDPELRTGDRVYTLGVPLGLTLTISEGVVSATDHETKNFTYPCVLNTADISHGSSGGALLNVYGRVVGVTTGAYESANSLYITVPATPLLDVDLDVEGIPLPQVMEERIAKESGGAA